MEPLAILDALWCGQGMANVLRVFNDSSVDTTTTPADKLCVFDFGSGGLSASKKVLGITPPVRFLIDQLKLQIAAKRPPFIDLMLISHQDRDHWLLLSELDQQLHAQNIDLKIGQIVGCGSEWSVNPQHWLKKYAARTLNEDTYLTWYKAESSDYMYPTSPLSPTYSLGNVNLQMLVTNVASSNNAIDIVRNCSSAVVLLQLGASSFILPGDATWETFMRLQAIMGVWTKSPLPKVYAASVPHHGALRTMNRSVSTVDLQDLVWFTDYTQPASIFASAGYNNTHSHPYLSILATMGEKTLESPFKNHSIVVFNASTNKFEHISAMTRSIYTSLISIDKPECLNFSFSISPSSCSTMAYSVSTGSAALFMPPTTDPTFWVDDIEPTDADLDTTMFLAMRNKPIRWVENIMKPPRFMSQYEPLAPPPRRVRPSVS